MVSLCFLWQQAKRESQVSTVLSTLSPQAQRRSGETPGDFSLLKSPQGPSKAQVSCIPDELWSWRWIMPCFCTSLS